MRFMDFSFLPGKPGYFLWKIGIIGFWQKFILRRLKLTEEHRKKIESLPKTAIN